MWAVWVAAATVVMVMLLQRAGTERQHSSGAHVETVGSQGGGEEDVVTTEDAVVDDGLSEVLGMDEEDVEIGSDEEGELDGSVEDEAGRGSKDELDCSAEDEDGKDAVLLTSIDEEALSDGTTEETNTGVETDSEMEVEMARLDSSVELDIARAELTGRAEDKTGACG